MRAYPNLDGCTITCTLLKPKSVGYITLKSANPNDAPLIYANALQDKDDVQVLIDGVKLARKAFAQPSLKKHAVTEVAPGTNVQTDDQIESYVRNIAQTLYHPVGTCKMGANDDTTAVVSPDLKVYGVQRLRVVDASVMPTITRGNTYVAKNILTFMK